MWPTRQDGVQSYEQIFTCFFFSQDPYFKIPTDEEPFQNLITQWTRDQVFAEQRLAGVNPMTLMRVTTDKGKNMYLNRRNISKALPPRGRGVLPIVGYTPVRVGAGQKGYFLQVLDTFIKR